jgi:amino acid transporter
VAQQCRRFGIFAAGAVLIVLSFLFCASGSATHFTWAAMMPHASVKNAIFWSTIFYAFAGVECASFMGGEIKNARRTVPRALLFAGVLVTSATSSGTIAMLVAMPSEQISGLGGFMTAMAQMCQTLWRELDAVAIALMVTLSCLGAAGAYLASALAAALCGGIDNYLPLSSGAFIPSGIRLMSPLFYGLRACSSPFWAGRDQCQGRL